MPTVICPHCQHVNEIDGAAPGQRVECIRCDGAFAMPGLPIAKSVENRSVWRRLGDGIRRGARAGTENMRRERETPPPRSQGLSCCGCSFVLFAALAFYLILLRGCRDQTPKTPDYDRDARIAVRVWCRENVNDPDWELVRCSQARLDDRKERSVVVARIRARNAFNAPLLKTFTFNIRHYGPGNAVVESAVPLD